MLLRRADVEYALRNWQDYSSEFSGMMGSEEPIIPLNVDPPLHVKYRKLIDPYFSPKKMASLQPAVQQHTNDLIDGFIDRGACDFSTELAVPLCGMAKDKYYIHSGEVFSGNEAERIGLVSKCVPTEEVLPTALALALALANKLSAGSQVAIRLSKKALNGWFQLASPIVEHSVALEMLSFLHPDAIEGLTAGRARRPAVFPSIVHTEAGALR